jgi:hypothetical protein
MTICVICGKNASGKSATAGSRRQQASGLYSPDERKSTYDSCSFVLIETRSAPALTRCYPRSFTFYVGNPFPQFVVKELRQALNEGTLRAFRDAHRFTTFKIFRRPGAF